MNQHPDLNMFSEIFNCLNVGIDKDLFDFTPEVDGKTGRNSKESHDRMCTKAHCEKAHEKYDGFKLLLCHLKNDVEEYLPRANVILLHRRNLFERYVSQRVAILTKKWYSSQEFLGKVKLSLEDIERDVEAVVHQYKKFESLDTTNIFYEDDPFENVNKICDALDIKRFTPEINSKKRILRPMLDVVSNYEEVKDFDHENYFH